MMRWHLSHRYDARALPLANRHYNRQTPESPQFVPPGKNLVLLTRDASALWVTSWPLYAGHAWEGAWINTLFRNENPARDLSSELILEAVAATRARFGDPPAIGLITFVDPSKTRRKRDPGRCYRKAGFRVVGTTKARGLLALQLLPADMPPPHTPTARSRRFSRGEVPGDGLLVEMRGARGGPAPEGLHGVVARVTNGAAEGEFGEGVGTQLGPCLPHERVHRVPEFVREEPRNDAPAPREGTAQDVDVLPLHPREVARRARPSSRRALAVDDGQAHARHRRRVPCEGGALGDEDRTDLALRDGSRPTLHGYLNAAGLRTTPSSCRSAATAGSARTSASGRRTPSTTASGARRRTRCE